MLATRLLSRIGKFVSVVMLVWVAWPHQSGRAAPPNLTSYTQPACSSNSIAPPAAFPGVNGKIVFTSNRDGNTEIYVMNPDGSDQTNLTNNPASDYSPAWSPDGTRIAFVSSRNGGQNVFVMNANGTGVTPLTTSQFSYYEDPSWSPSGTQIVTSRDEAIVIIDANGTGGSTFVTGGRQPVWSPDGSRIAFRAYTDTGNIALVNPNGTGFANVTNNPISDLSYAPNWSPDGTRVAFEHLMGGSHDIWAINPWDGTGRTNLTNASGSDVSPSWSPNGTRIAFSTYRHGAPEIYVMNADGTGQTPLTNNTSYDMDPDWQPVQAPVSVTAAASDVTFSSARLNGTVNPNGYAATAWFAWCLDPNALDTDTTHVTLSAGTTPQTVTAELTGLSPNTTYYFQMVGEGPFGGPQRGTVRSFQTPVSPEPTPVSAAATLVTSTGATLNGTVDPNGTNTTHWFEWSLNNPPTAHSTFVESTGSGTEPVAVAATLTGLTPLTVYYFRVAAQRAGGDVQRSAVLTFQTPAAVPSAVTGGVTSVTTSTATLHGTVNPNTVATSWWFEWDTVNPPSGSQSTGDMAAGSGSTDVPVSAPLTNLNGNTTYYYRLVARGPAPNFQIRRGDVQQFTTVAAPDPSPVTDPADTITTSGAQLRGRVNPNAAATTSWFQYGSSNPPTTNTPAVSIGSGSTQVSVAASVTGLVSGQLHYYRTVARGPNNTNVYGATLSFTTELPDPIPQTGTASNRTATSATVGGTVNPNGVAAEYFVEYGTTSPPADNTTPIGNLAAGTTAVAVTRDLGSLVPGTTYYYRLAARRPGGTTVRGAIAQFDTLTSEPTPTTGAANGIGPTTATLNGTVNPNSVATSYWFEWGTSTLPPTDPPPALSTTAVTSAGSGSNAVPASAVLNALVANTTYYYRLVARGPSNQVQRGSVQQFQTNLIPEPAALTIGADTITTSGATLRGRVNPNGIVTSAWFQWGTSDPPTNETSPVALGTGTTEQNVSAGLSGLLAAQRYYFRTVARGSTNQNQYGSTLSFMTEALDPALQLGSPTNVTPTSITLNGTINPNGSPVDYWFEFGSSDPPTSVTLTGSLPAGSQPIAVSSQISGLTGASVFFRLAVRKTGGSILRSSTASVALTREPIVTACTPSHITATSARLNASVNPNGVTTVYWFEWGAANSTPTLTVELPAGRGTAPVEAFTTVTGLAGDSSYYCRLVARGPSNVAVRGTDGTFTTPVLAEPTISTDAADPVHATSATLRGRVNPRGSDTIVWFEWGPTAGNLSERTSQQPAGAGAVEQPFSATITDLPPATPYYFRAVARGPSGVTQYGSPTRSFVTTAIEPDVRTEGCSSVLPGGMTLNGSVNPNGSAAEYWFRVGRANPPTEFETARVAASNGVAFAPVNANLTALLPNQKYYYRVVAQRPGGPIREGDIRDCQTTTRPPDVQTLAATDVSVDGARVNARINPHNWPTQYWFQWGTSEASLTDTPIQALLSGASPADVFSVLTGLRPATDYAYRVVAQGTSRVEGAFQRFRTRDDEVSPGRGRVFVTLYWDANDNGTRDTGELPVASAESTCRGADDPVDGDGYLAIRWAGGAESGSARPVGCQPGPVAVAGNLLPGSYKFSVVLPQSVGYFIAWRQTEHDPSRREKTVAVAAGETVNLSFGVRRDEGQLLRSPVNNIARGIPIVLVHGWCGSAENWNSFEQYFQSVAALRSRFTLWRFVYSTGARGAVSGLVCDRTGVPDHSAARIQGLGAELRRLIDTNSEFGTSRIIVMGHSLGGLIARSYMQEGAGQSRVEYLLTLATPHHGLSPDALAAAVLSGDYKPGELSAFEWDAYPRDDRGNPWLRCLNGFGDQGCLLPASGTRASARVATLSKTIAMGTLVNAQQTDPLVPLTSSLFSAPRPPLLSDRYTGVCGHHGILDAACRLSKSVATWATEFSVAPTPGEGSTGVFDLIATILRSVGRRPTNVNARAEAGTALILWEPPTGGAATELRYQVEGQPRSLGDSWFPISPPVTTTTHSLTGVPTGSYAIRVLALHPDGSSEPSEAVPLDVGICVGPPGIPIAVTPTVVGSVVTVAWQAPADGCPPTGYQVSVGSGPGLSNIVNLPWAAPPIAGNVTNGVFYLRVRAVNGSFMGASSPESIISVGMPAPPAAPTNVTATTSPGAVSFSWTASPSATGYLLEAGSAPGLADLVTVPLSAATTHAFTGVPRGRYFVRVRGVNASGPGAASVELEVIVP